VSPVDEELEALAASCRPRWPSFEIIVDAGAVWLRDWTTGIDWGLYSRTITGEVYKAYDDQGRTTLQRPTPDCGKPKPSPG